MTTPHRSDGTQTVRQALRRADRYLAHTVHADAEAGLAHLAGRPATDRGRLPGGAPAAHRGRRTGVLVAGGVAAVTALAAAAAVVLPHGTRPTAPVARSGASASTGAPRVDVTDAPMLLRAASVAAARRTAVVRDDQFVYAETVTVDTYGGPRRQTRTRAWESVDGTRPGWITSVDKLGHPYSTATDPRLRPRATGRRAVDGRPAPALPAVEPSLWNPTYRYLTTLPADPRALLAAIRAEVRRSAGTKPGAIPDTDQAAFGMIGDLLQLGVLPPRLAAALYQAAAAIPGVRIVPDAVDAAGRHGVGVVRSSAAAARPAPGEVGSDPIFRMEWIFDRHDYRYLGQEAQSRLGTAAIAIVTSGVVDRTRQLPS